MSWTTRYNSNSDLHINSYCFFLGLHLLVILSTFSRRYTCLNFLGVSIRASYTLAVRSSFGSPSTPFSLSALRAFTRLNPNVIAKCVLSVSTWTARMEEACGYREEAD
jgi:hypothetical protein